MPSFPPVRAISCALRGCGRTPAVKPPAAVALTPPGLVTAGFRGSRFARAHRPRPHQSGTRETGAPGPSKVGRPRPEGGSMSSTASTAMVSLQLVSLEQIQVPDGNPRRRFDERALRELADSIGKHGVLQPLVVRTTDGGYTLIAGERRYRAAKLAGLKQVPVTLRDADEDSPLELAVDENLHREDLDPVEEAHAFQAILSSGGLNKKQLAERVSKSPQYVND